MPPANSTKSKIVVIKGARGRAGRHWRPDEDRDHTEERDEEGRAPCRTMPVEQRPSGEGTGRGAG